MNSSEPLCVSTFKFSWTKYVLLMALLVFIGCAEAQHPDVDAELAKSVVKSGALLDDIVAKLGEPHSPSAGQVDYMKKSTKRFANGRVPEPNYDEARVWGNDATFFAVFTNEQGVVNRTIFHVSGKPKN